MALTPLCQVKDGAGPFVGTVNGVDVTPSNTISIQLLNSVGVVNWFLQIIGTDELTTNPTLTGVNPSTHLVASPTTVVTFTFPAGLGSAIGFKSTVTGVGGPVDTTFGIYSLTSFLTRVGFVTETREGDTDFGWASKVNPLIRTGGGGGGDAHYTLTDIIDEKTIPEREAMLFEDHVVIEEGGNLILEGDATSIRTEDNFSILHIPFRTERVVQQNDELLYTDDMIVDGQLTVDGQLVDATPYDGYDVLAVLAEIGVTPFFVWSSTISGPGTFNLQINKVNRYLSGPGMTLRFPVAGDGAELDIKECSASAGTAPDVVVVDTNSGFINVENIGVGGNTQTDNLTEYKTWVKYKYDANQSVWRIVGAAYQLP